HLWAIDFEQRIAALDVVAELADYARDATGERRQHNGAGVLVKCDLTDRLFLQTKRIWHNLHDAQLMHLVGLHPDGIGVAQWSLKRRLREYAVPHHKRNQHLRQYRNPRAADSDLEHDPQDFWRDPCCSALQYGHH